MNAFRQHFSRDPPKQREHSDMARIHPDHGGKYRNHQNEGGQRNCEQAKCGTSICVNHPTASVIEDRH